MAEIFFSVLMYYAFLRLRFGRWIRIYTGFSALLGSVVLVALALGSLSVGAILVALFPLLFLNAGVIPVLLMVHLYRGNREAGILLIPSILSSLTLYLSFLNALLALIPPLAFLFRILNDLLFQSHNRPLHCHIQPGDGLPLFTFAGRHHGAPFHANQPPAGHAGSRARCGPRSPAAHRSRASRKRSRLHRRECV